MDPTFEKLDRFLVSPGWDLMYNNVSVFSLNRSFSDHSHLCLNSGDVHRPNKDFRYELCWRLRPNFRHMVIDN